MGYRELVATLQLDRFTTDRLNECVHCGLCLPNCPTYRVLGIEADSPRGRLHLIKSLADGEIEPSEGVVKHLTRCLVCRNCETVCPSGVKFGWVMDTVRDKLEGKVRVPKMWSLAKEIILKHIFPRPSRLRLALLGLSFAQKTGLEKLVKKSGVLRTLPGDLEQLADLAPPISGKFFNPSSYEVIKPLGEIRYRVGLLSGCIMSTVFADIDRATVSVLARNGCEVVIPRSQNCCGALHIHEGNMKIAKQLARQNIDAFTDTGIETVIVNSAGCGAVMKEYVDLLRDDSEYSEKAKSFSRKVEDITEFLARIPLNKKFGSLDLTVTYQDPCHLIHGQRIKSQPRAVLKQIPGLTLVEMKDADQCCGGAGIYNITEKELSMKILDRKIESVCETNCQVIVASNPPCLVQYRYGIGRHNSRQKVVHIVELLEEAYQKFGKET